MSEKLDAMLSGAAAVLRSPVGIGLYCGMAATLVERNADAGMAYLGICALLYLGLFGDPT